MKLIKLSQNKFACVDNEDFEYLNQWKWSTDKGKNTFYAYRRDYSKKIKIYMHSLVVHTPKGMYTDHKDSNGLNNQKNNLRIVTNSQNMMNSKSQNTSSKYKGVSWFKRNNKWQAYIMQNYKRLHLGYFNSEIEAARKYDIKAQELFGQFAKLNFN